MDLIGGRSWELLNRALDAFAVRQRVIAHNVANLNTPGYKKYRVRFEEELQEARRRSDLPLYRTHPQHLDPRRAPEEAEPEVVRETATSSRPDGNNVDLTEQMVQLAMNQFYYQLAAQSASGYLARLRLVITGGRR
ncbi:MAG: flagellar basal body rod protein FlgB [Clostridia bacterium]|nr:flagellar basal body rod protein FlgB [Clostridia bacterium]MDH7573448.1 flagellar basal body rod protein FlgB [Clostridia bacterium]